MTEEHNTEGRSLIEAPQPNVVTRAEISFEAMERMAERFAASGMFAVKSADQALSLLMIAQAEGLHPAQAMMEFDIISGKPVRKAEKTLARFLASGGRVKWLKMTDAECEAEFSHPLGSAIVIRWDIARAKQANLLGKDNWKHYPRAMLRARVIGEGARSSYPGYATVTMTYEEAVDMGPARVVDETPISTDPAAEREAIEEMVARAEKEKCPLGKLFAFVQGVPGPLSAEQVEAQLQSLTEDQLKRCLSILDQRAAQKQKQKRAPKEEAREPAEAK